LPAAAAATAAVSTAAAAAVFFRPGLIDIQRPAIEFPAIQTGNGCIGFGRHTHFHESKASGTSGVPVGNDVDTVHRAIFLKHRSNRIFGSSEAEVSNENILQLRSSF
jgi:hypothetical protein